MADQSDALQMLKEQNEREHNLILEKLDRWGKRANGLNNRIDNLERWQSRLGGVSATVKIASRVTAVLIGGIGGLVGGFLAYLLSGF